MAAIAILFSQPYQFHSLGGHDRHLCPQPVAPPVRVHAQPRQHSERCGSGHGLGPPVARILPQDEAQREIYLKMMEQYTPEQLVFIDETHLNRR